MMIFKKQVMKKWKKERIITITIVSSFAMTFAIIVLVMSFYKYKILNIGIADNVSSNQYQYHFAMITEEAEDPFWESVYEGALKKGKEQNIYVEKIGSHLSVQYSLEELMQIAIASKVDGIMIEPSGEKNITEMINKANAAGIPVITVLNDDPVSERKSFVGISSYSQGQAYAQQIQKIAKTGKKKAVVLLHGDSKDTSQNIVYSSICDNVDKEQITVDSILIPKQDSFSSEEYIRDLIMQKNPPDMIVCMTSVDTLCAYQAVVDYNKVGTIEIIGYYDSDLILNGIEKKIIHSTMAVDAEQMGSYCVDALAEYKKTKRVSDYFSVDINIINADNIKEFKVK